MTAARTVRGSGAALALEGVADEGAHDAVESVRRARVRATRIAADVRREAMARAVRDMAQFADMVTP